MFKSIVISEFEMSYVQAVKLSNVCAIKMERVARVNQYYYIFENNGDDSAINLIAESCYHGIRGIIFE